MGVRPTKCFLTLGGSFFATFRYAGDGSRTGCCIVRIKLQISIGVSYAPLLRLTAGASLALAHVCRRPRDSVTPGGSFRRRLILIGRWVAPWASRCAIYGLRKKPPKKHTNGRSTCADMFLVGHSNRKFPAESLTSHMQHPPFGTYR